MDKKEKKLKEKIKTLIQVKKFIEKTFPTAKILGFSDEKSNSFKEYKGLT